ncbi:MAG: glutamyl-tRNA reductase [Micrococcales bacterium]|nr:glutamyl-tRNA reductase [Micrococcales bacterium]
MSLLVIGLSHHTAPITILEDLANDADRAVAIASRVRACPVVSEVIILSTCNRLEVYAEVSAFHPAVSAVGQALEAVSGEDGQTLVDHLYVRYDDNAVAHAFAVACGLDSMAVGEGQILGQMRDALALAQRSGMVGESLNSLFQQALRVGKRAHAETAIDQHSVSLVEAGLEEASTLLGCLATVRASVIGAGAMSGLSVAALARAGVGELEIVNRTPERAHRLARSAGGRFRDWADLTDVIATSDLVVSCTGAVGHVITGTLLADAAARRDLRAQVIIDLALPRDVEPASEWPAALPTVTVLDLETLGGLLGDRSDQPEVDAVKALVAGEVASYQTRRVEHAVAPTVAALRHRAAQVVAAEMDRLDHRLPDLDDHSRAEIALTVHRVVEKLLHTPTRRVKQFASEGNVGPYETALRELFDLDLDDVANVAVPPKRVGA